jgi:hypothetical protein
MKFNAFFVFLLILVISNCGKTDKLKLLTKDCTGSDTCQAKVFIDPDDKAIANSVLIKKHTKLRFVKAPEITKAMFIIPKADVLFQNLHTNKYDSLMIGNTNYLFITLENNENKSKQFKIREESNLTNDPKYYPYSVYLPVRDEMAESNSSPAIIVEP